MDKRTPIINKLDQLQKVHDEIKKSSITKPSNFLFKKIRTYVLTNIDFDFPIKAKL